MTQQGAGCGRADSQRLSDLIKAFVLVVAPDQDLTLAARQPANCFRKRAANLLGGKVLIPLWRWVRGGFPPRT